MPGLVSLASSPLSGLDLTNLSGDPPLVSSNRRSRGGVFVYLSAVMSRSTHPRFNMYLMLLGMKSESEQTPTDVWTAGA